MSPYAAADGTPAADTREVKATDDGKMVQVIMDATTHTTMTALRGCPSTTRETQGENGKTPSLATANTSLEAARTAMAVFCRRLVMSTLLIWSHGTDGSWRRCPYKPKSDDANNVHNDMRSVSENSCI